MKLPTSVLMMPMDTVFRAITQARRAAYRSGLFVVSKLPAPVISVGNLTTGGTGKTPLVEWVCRAIAKESQLAGKPRKICVLTRGYGRVNPKSQVVVSDGARLLANELEAGDEPFLLAQNLLGVAAVVANPDRVAAGNWSMENLNANLFVLDDGFQHLRLARNLDLVVIDATNPWGGGRLLPSGRLRETPEALARASCVIITRADQVEDIAPLRTQIQELADDAPVLSSRMITSRISTLAGQSVNPPDIKQPVGAFCGVGNPESFFAQLRNEGQALTFTRAFPDHHRYSQAEINDLEGAAKASGAQTLITTAKDATKLSSLDLGLPCYVLEIEISIDGEERLIKLIRDAIA